MFPTKINHSCLECWSKTISLSLSFPDTELCSSASCALHVLFEIMCQMAVKQFPFLTGFPPLGSHRKSAGLYTSLAGLLRLHLWVLKFQSCFSLSVLWKNLKSWFRERKRRWERRENTMSSLYVCMHTICVHNQHVLVYIIWFLPKKERCYY